jgi:hypothetical protein
MHIHQDAIEIVQRVKATGVSSGLVLDEVLRVSQKIINDEPLSYFEISFLDLIRDSLECHYLADEEE